MTDQNAPKTQPSGSQGQGSGDKQPSNQKPADRPVFQGTLIKGDVKGNGTHRRKNA